MTDKHRFVELTDDANDRYARQKLVAGWDQERLAAARVLVVGAGALGNEVIKNLVLIGIGYLKIIDFDCIELSNLSRTVLFNESQIGLNKAVAAAHAASRLNPNVLIEALDGDFELDIGYGEIATFDAVLGCVDSVNARWAINRACMRMGVPWINAGIGAFAGEVSVFNPDQGACYECNMTDSMWRRFNERASCMLLARRLPPSRVPTTVMSAAMIAALQTGELLSLLHDRETRLKGGQKLFLSTSPHSSFVVDTERLEDCPAHDRYRNIVRIELSPTRLTAEELLQQVPEALAITLDFDLVTELKCASCGSERVQKPAKRLRLLDLHCPACGALRTPSFASEIMAGQSGAQAKLATLGLCKDSIVVVRTASGNIPVQLG